MSADGSISARAIVTTELVGEASRLQGLEKLAAAALGRALTCSLLVAEGLKDDESFQVKFDGDGPLRGVLAMANGRLESRGCDPAPFRRLQLASPDPPLGPPSAAMSATRPSTCRRTRRARSTWAAASGEGRCRHKAPPRAPPRQWLPIRLLHGPPRPAPLQVLRTKQLPGETRPSQFSSITEIKTGEIPEDINAYLLESEQVAPDPRRR
jgi:molecular chaperone Hsp33